MLNYRTVLEPLLDALAEAAARGDRTEANRLLAELDLLAASISDRARRWVATELRARVTAGALAAGATPRMAAAVLATESARTLRLIAASLTQMTATTRAAVRNELARATVATIAGTPVRTAARQAAARLRPTLGTVTYRNGARVPIHVYTEMVARTESAIAYNRGLIEGYRALGRDPAATWVEVLDGSDCGWTHHDDDRTANGMIVTLGEAAEHLVAHPNCRRAFMPRPDIATAEQASTAESIVDPESRADQTAYERTVSTRRVRRVASARTVRAPATVRG